MTKKSFLHKSRIILILLSIICLMVALVILRHLATGDDNSPVNEPAYKGRVQHRLLLLASYHSQYYTFAPQIDGLRDSFDQNGIEFDVIA